MRHNKLTKMILLGVERTHENETKDGVCGEWVVCEWLMQGQSTFSVADGRTACILTQGAGTKEWIPDVPQARAYPLRAGLGFSFGCGRERRGSSTELYSTVLWYVPLTTTITRWLMEARL